MKVGSSIIYTFIKLFISIVTIMMPIFNYSNLKIIFIVIFSLYGIINLVQYMIDKDKQNIFYSLNSFLLVILSILLNINGRQRYLALSLGVWFIISSLIKLKRVDNYRDSKASYWKFYSLSLGIFVLAGLLALINLGYPHEIEVLVVGFLLFIENSLELLNSLVKTITK